jgi:hypothetical protein
LVGVGGDLMPFRSPEVQVGEEWAYRERTNSNPTLVRVTKVGTARPPRVKIRFLDDAFEGREEWVPPSRLKVLWADLDAWRAREDRWDAIAAASVGVDRTPELWAAETVFEVVAGEDVLSTGYREHAGVLCISDASKAADLLGTDLSSFLSDELAFVDDDGTIVVPWNITLELARDAAPKHADAVLRDIADKERKAAQHAIYGDLIGTRRSKPWYVSPKVCAEVDARQVPTYALLRQWCGEDAVGRFDELAALRTELLRFGQLIERAISALEEAGLSKIAASLKRELGVPIGTLRASQMKGGG